MKHRSKLSPEQQQSEQQAAAHQTQHQAGQEFATAEELLRFDAAQTAVPPQIAERLKQSAAQLPPPPRRSWWKNLLGQ
jgi:nucleosome binding factor SPN SPT16 subunit